MKFLPMFTIFVLITFGSIGCECESESESESERMKREMQEARDTVSVEKTEKYKKINEVYIAVLSILSEVKDQETASTAIPKIKSLSNQYADARMADIPSMLGDPTYVELNREYEDAQTNVVLIQSELSRIGELGGKNSNSYNVALVLNTGKTLDEYLNQ